MTAEWWLPCPTGLPCGHLSYDLGQQGSHSWDRPSVFWVGVPCAVTGRGSGEQGLHAAYKLGALVPVGVSLRMQPWAELGICLFSLM